jgi:hypothetical protein
LTAAYQHLQSYPLLLCDNSWELFFGSYNLTLEWAIDLFASPRMTSRLVLVIGDLFIPDRAPDLPAKVHIITPRRIISGYSFVLSLIDIIAVSEAPHARQDWPDSVSG